MENPQKLDGLKTEDPVALASAVAGRVEIRAVRLIQSACRQTPRAAQVKQFNAQLNRASRVQVDVPKNAIAVIVHFEFAGRDAMQPADAVPDLQLSADFLVLYATKSLSGLGDAHYERFGELNGTYNAWPYWREFLQSTMSRMGITPFLLPVFRIAQAAQEATKRERSDSMHQPPPVE